MDANKRYEMLRLNSLEQNDLVLYDLLREGKFEKFQQLIKDGYGLDAFILNSMVDNGFADKIDETISFCRQWHDNTFNFLVFFWGREKTEDYWFEHADERVWPRKLSYDGLVRHQQWDILFEREAFDKLALYAPMEFLKKIQDAETRKKIISVLLTNNLFDKILALDWKDEYALAAKMQQYLLHNDLKKLLSLPLPDDFYLAIGFISKDKFYQYLYKHGEEEYLLYKTDYFEKNRIVEPLLRCKMYYSLARIGCYDVIDWEVFLTSHGDRVTSYYAEKAQNWDFLCKHKKHWVLLKHFRLWRFIKSFF